MGGIVPAGEWYRANTGEWVAAKDAHVFVKWERKIYNLPDGGEWIEIYVNVPVEVTR
jgi:hypothetical protein